MCGRKGEGYPARTGETSTTGGVDPVVTTGVVLVLVVVAVAVGDEVAVATQLSWMRRVLSYWWPS